MKYTDEHRLKKWMNTDKSKCLRRLICLFLTVLLYLSHSLVWAEPKITNAPSTIQHKQSITVSGSGFGTKNPAAPLKWDDFESGTNGSLLKGWKFWSGNDGQDPTYSNEVQRGKGKLTALSHIRHHYNANFYSELEGPTEYEVYVTGYYYYLNLGEYASRMYKVWRVGDDPMSGGASKSILGGESIQYDGAWSYVYSWSGAGTSDVQATINPSTTPGRWIRSEAYGKLSDISVPNGERHITYYMDGQKPQILINQKNVVTRDINTTWKYQSFALYVARDLNLDGTWKNYDIEYKSYYDDIYIDKTQARVELCDGPTWSNRIRCEIQIPIAWSSNSITFTANQGSFANGQTAYLYVVDENGNVNEQGYLVSFGSGSFLGDVNGDAKVDIKDLILVAKDFGKTSGFNPGCDLNKDGKIDIKDLIIVAKNFGK